MHLADYVDAVAEESAQADAYAWIKALRRMTVDGVPFRSRFTLRGDSLWWFAELYLHKERVILELFRTIAALDTLIAREQPQRLIARGRRSDMVRMVRVGARPAVRRQSDRRARRSSPGSTFEPARLRWRRGCRDCVAVGRHRGRRAAVRRSSIAPSGATAGKMAARE